MGSTINATRRWGDGTDLGERERDLVGRERHRLGVEVAARENAGIGAEHERVVGDRIGLDGERSRGLTEQIDARAGDLRLAAEAVCILNARVSVPVALLIAEPDMRARIALATSICPR